MPLRDGPDDDPESRSFSAGPAENLYGPEYYQEGGTQLVEVEQVPFSTFIAAIDSAARAVVELAQGRRWVELPRYDEERDDPVTGPRSQITLPPRGRGKGCVDFLKLQDSPNLFARHGEKDPVMDVDGPHGRTNGFQVTAERGGTSIEWAYYDSARRRYIYTEDPTGQFLLAYLTLRVGGGRDWALKIDQSGVMGIFPKTPADYVVNQA